MTVSAVDTVLSRFTPSSAIMSSATSMPMLICTPRLVLRLPDVSDLHGYLAYRNEPAALAAQAMSPLDEQGALSFLEQQTNLDISARGWHMFALERHAQAGIIGEVGMFIDKDHARQADLGWWLNADYRNLGYALEAVTALVKWCFVDLGLHRVTAHCLAQNAKSRNIMARAGMRLESTTIESFELNQAWHDEVGYALLRREYLARADAQ